MLPQYRIPKANQQEAQEMCMQLTQSLEMFLSPLLIWLDAYLDKRLVRTFVPAIAAILTFRSRGQGLNLTELGSSIDSEGTAASGTCKIA